MAKITRVPVRHDPDAPEVVQAAQIAFRVMAAAKADTWSDAVAVDDLRERVVLTDTQQTILARNDKLLPMLRRRGPIVTVHACGTCGRFAFADGATTGRKCWLSVGCDGSPAGATTTAWKPKPNPAPTADPVPAADSAVPNAAATAPATPEPEASAAPA